MLKKIFYVIFTFILSSHLSWSQIPENDFIESLIEEITESNDKEIDFSSLYEDLNYYLQNPLNLNEASEEDLEKFQFLTDFHIEDILGYIRVKGVMLSVYELQYLESFSGEDIKKLLPFIRVEIMQEKTVLNLKKALKYGRNSLFLRTQFLLQDQKGFLIDSPKNKSYIGNKYKYYTRYQFDYKRKLKFGFIAEKDAGEAFFRGSQKYGFDYYGAHLELNDIGRFKSINIGDFQVRFGQGLIAWSGLSFGKSPYVTNVKKKYDGLRKYSSSDENKFMRGAGTTINLGRFDLTGFISYKHIDGNLNDTDSIFDEEMYFTSFLTTGLHRNKSELTDRKSISEFIYGGNIKFKNNKFKLGASYIEYFFGEDIKKDPRLYNQYDFTGNHGLNASIDYQTNFKKIYFFGEEAISLNGGFALLNSMVMKPAPGISIAILQRYYSKDYQALYASGFAEQSKTQNENGVYLGAEISPVRKIKLSTYFDIFQFPWLKYRVYAPSSGSEFFAQLDYNLNKDFVLYVKYKQEIKEINATDEFLTIYTLTQTQKRQLRFHANYSLSDNLLLRNRIEFSDYTVKDKNRETGFMIYQDINYKASAIPLNINLRIAFFDSDYDARIYAYENDILYGYSIPAYNGRGIRTYMNFRYTLVKDHVDIWLRFANTAYSSNSKNLSEAGEIGTGYDAIKGLNKSEIKFQIRIKF